jgi:hypothetical protein
MKDIVEKEKSICLRIGLLLLAVLEVDNWWKPDDRQWTMMHQNFWLGRDACQNVHFQEACQAALTAEVVFKVDPTQICRWRVNQENGSTCPELSRRQAARSRPGPN